MSSGKKAQPLSEAKSLTRKEQLWLPGTPEKSSFQGSFYQPRTPQRHNISIADGMIHTTVAQLDNVPLKSMSNWPISLLCRSLFLAHESMTLCGLGAGELCQVLVDDEERGIYWAWPLSSSEEKIEVLMTWEAICSLCLLSGDDPTVVTIKKWTETPLTTDLLQLRAKNTKDQEFLAHPAFQAVTALTCKNIVITESTNVVINYYGRVVPLLVDQILPSVEAQKDLDRVVRKLEGINLNFSQLENESDRGLATSTPCKQDNKSTSSKLHYLIAEKTILKFKNNICEEATEDKEIATAKEILDNIGGLNEEMEIIRQASKTVLGPKPSRSFVGILLHGASGSGKTLLGKSLPAILNHKNFIAVSGTDFGSIYSGGSEAKLRELFERAKSQDKTVLFVDEIDVLCTNPERVKNEQERRLCSAFRSLIDDLTTSKNCHVFLVAATGLPDAIDPSMRRPGRLDVEIEINVPTVKSRQEILTKLLQTTNQSELTTEDILKVAQAAHGFVGADLHALCRAATDQEGFVSMESFKRALKMVKPSAMRQVQVEVPDVKWSDIGGMDELKMHLKQSVEWPLRHPEVYEKMGISPPRGILMYGPPGCSKTMIAKALANESKLNFVSIKGPELFSKWVGDSELAVRALFAKARRVAPCIIFFDEIDALGSERGSSSGGKVGDRVLAQMLTEMDGVEQLKDVTILAATNRPDMIDKALMRPGRLDRVEYVPLPDFKTRLQVFKIHTNKKPLKNVDLDELATLTEGYSGAEIAAVCNESALKALEEIMSTPMSDEEVIEASRDASITRDHFQQALNIVQPRINQELLKVYEKFQQKNNRS